MLVAVDLDKHRKCHAIGECEIGHCACLFCAIEKNMNIHAFVDEVGDAWQLVRGDPHGVEQVGVTRVGKGLCFCQCRNCCG